MRERWIAVWAVVCLVLPGVALAQSEWVDEPGDPVLGPGEPGAWDDSRRNPLEVIEVDGTYHLFFNGQTSDGTLLDGYDIGHATSADGVTWEIDPANPVMTRGDAGQWDETSLWGAAVIHDDSGFRMWFAGFNEGPDTGGVGYATSPDGSTWTKHEDNPIMGFGESGSFDANGVNPVSVVVRDGYYQMWYVATHGTTNSTYDWQIGYAESDDGLTWNKRSEPVFEPGSGWEMSWIYHASVNFDGADYRMWYAGAIANSHVAIGYAVSGDGIEWERYWGNPVIDATGTGAEDPNVLFNDETGTYEMWYWDNGVNGLRRAVSNCCSTFYAAIIPAAAYAAGAEGSFFETDLDLSNAGSEDVEYFLAWLPRGESNTGPVESNLFTLGAGKSVRYSNVLAEVFDLEPDAFGALMIEASGTDLLAMARIANLPPDMGEGSFGQSIPPIEIGDFSGLAVKRRLLLGTENAEMRFNVGCLNAGDTAARINFELFSADGTLLGTESLILMPWSNDQLNRIFDPYHPVTGYVDFWSAAASGKIYCYGSALDNVTSDPTTVPPM